MVKPEWAAGWAGERNKMKEKEDSLALPPSSASTFANTPERPKTQKLGHPKQLQLIH